ncbi:hypothetical protein QUC31_009884 [Theobroma cacao]
MAESFLFNIAERVLEKIALLTVEEVRLAFNVENDLEELRDTMRRIKAVLLDAERQQHQNEALRLSIWKLRDLFYDAEDVIDEIECEALRKEVVNYPSTSIKFLHLYECEMLESIFDGMQRLTSLRRLAIQGCVRLISLPRSLKFLTKLEDINIGGCKKINLCMEVEEAEDQDLHLSLKTFSVSWSGRPMKEPPIGIKEQQADLVMDKSATACTLWKLSLCLLQSREPCIHVMDCDFN